MFRHAFIDRLKACGDVPVPISEAITGHGRKRHSLSLQPACWRIDAFNVRLSEALYNQIEELPKATARTKCFLAMLSLGATSYQVNLGE